MLLNARAEAKELFNRIECDVRAAADKLLNAVVGVYWTIRVNVAF